MAGRENYSYSIAQPRQVVFEGVSFSPEDRTKLPDVVLPLLPVIEEVPETGMRNHLNTLIDRFPTADYPVHIPHAGRLVAEVLYPDDTETLARFANTLHDSKYLPVIKDPAIPRGRVQYQLNEQGLLALGAASYFLPERRVSSRGFRTQGLVNDLKEALSDKGYETIFFITDVPQGYEVRNPKVQGSKRSEVTQPHKPESPVFVASVEREKAILSSMTLSRLVVLTDSFRYGHDELPSKVKALALHITEGDNDQETIRIQKGLQDIIVGMEYFKVVNLQQFIDILHDRRNSSENE